MITNELHQCPLLESDIHESMGGWPWKAVLLDDGFITLWSFVDTERPVEQLRNFLDMSTRLWQPNSCIHMDNFELGSINGHEPVRFSIEPSHRLISEVC